MFRDSKCFVTKSESNTVMGVGYLKNNLYYLGDSCPSQTPGVSVNNGSIQTFKNNPPIDKHALWHNRLGHISDSKLKLIPSLKLASHTQHKTCLICPMSKFTKLPYALSESHATAPFELIHVDTWGPYKVCTKQKYKYFLTIVDDFSRMTWLYLLQNKCDYGNTLSIFHSYVKNHFKSSIKTIRSDNAPEFSDQLCTKLMNDHGIVH